MHSRTVAPCFHMDIAFTVQLLTKHPLSWRCGRLSVVVRVVVVVRSFHLLLKFRRQRATWMSETWSFQTPPAKPNPKSVPAATSLLPSTASSF